VLCSLNKQYDYGLDLFLLSIDEGITGYRDDSLESVKRNQKQYMLPLKIVSYKELYGWTMDEIVKEIGRKNNCTFCGVFRRQALDRGAMLVGAEKIATGHNADDIAETVLMNSRLCLFLMLAMIPFFSASGRYRSAASVCRNYDWQRRKLAAVQTIQIYVRKGDRDVRLFQEAGLFFNRMRLFSLCVSRFCSRVSEGS